MLASYDSLIFQYPFDVWLTFILVPSEDNGIGGIVTDEEPLSVK